MIGTFARAALKSPAIAVGLAFLTVAGGLWAFVHLDIEAYPDPVPPMVEFISQPPGWAAEEVEKYLTVPMENALNGMDGLDHLRSISVFGLADVKAYFKWGTNHKADRQEALNRIGTVQLPQGQQASLSSANSIGEIYRYTLEGPYSLMLKKSIQDWVIAKQLRQVPGVVDVNGYGGLAKQYQVQIDPLRLRAYSVTLPQVMQALANANVAGGGNVLSMGEQSYNIRGLGLLRGNTDIEHVVVAAQKGIPVRVKDVASVVTGNAPRLGIVGHDDDDDIVQGIVLMKVGGNTLETLHGIHKKLGEIAKNRLLPPGMRIVPYYDRTDLVNKTIKTVMHNVVIGMLLVVGVLMLFLGNIKAALITAVNVPLALFAAIICLVVGGTPANLISLGAVDFGIIIDSTVIMMENIFRFLSHRPKSMDSGIAEAATEIGRPMAFSTIVIAVAFMPLFLMTGVSKVIFAPMAYTYAYAIGSAVLFAAVVTPVLSKFFLRQDMERNKIHEEDNWISRMVLRLYEPSLRLGSFRPGLMSLCVLIPLAAGGMAAANLGSEFLPKLEEGNFWIRASLPLSISLEKAQTYANEIRKILKQRPEVVTVVSQTGRPDDGTDVAGFYNIEFFAPLKPQDEWPGKMPKEELTALLSRQLSEAFPGVGFNFSQNIQDNVEEAMSGVKGENTIKVVGPNLELNNQKAKEIVAVMSSIPGIADLSVVQTMGQPSMIIQPDRAAAARYGINVSDINTAVQAAIGGQAVTQVFEDEARYDLVVRYSEAYRGDVQRIKEIAVSAPDNTPLPLAQLANISLGSGPSLIYREDNHRYVPVKFGVRGADLASVIEEAKKRIQEKIQLPYDTHLEWAGEINELEEARGRLATVIPLTLALIGMLVFFSVRSFWFSSTVLLEVPLACSGGLLALLVTGTPLSVSAAMGFVSLFGVAIQNGLLVVNYAQQLWKAGYSLQEGARLAAERRLRPVMMTTLVACFGLLPAALSNEIGAQAQKPLAIVVIGGTLMLIITRWALPAEMVLVGQRFHLLNRQAAAQSCSR